MSGTGLLAQVWKKAKAGERVRFSDGRIYERQADGSIRRIHPIKPWSNKAEHKAHKKARRLAREEAV